MAKRARVKVKSGGRVTRREAEAQFNRKKQQQRWRQLRHRCVVIGGGILCIVVVVMSWRIQHSGALQQWAGTVAASGWQLTADIGFNVQQVYLDGREHADVSAVKTALSVKPGAPILPLRLKEMQARLEAIAEVKSAVISRQLPNTLRVTLTERQPVALWQRGITHTPVDIDGVVLAKERYPKLGALPVIVGSDAPKHVRELIGLLASEPSLQPDIVAAVRVGERRWNVQLKRDITVMLPETDPARAWKRFATLAKRDGLLKKDIRSVDMRIDDRVFIMPIAEQKSMITLTSERET